MSPRFLLDDQVRRENGCSPAFDVASFQGRTLLLTLGITQILEHECLNITLEGSPEGESWDTVAALPPKCYCGSYDVSVDLRARPEIRYVRVHWTMRRWAAPDPVPLFRFSIEAQAAWERGQASLAATAAG